MKYSCPKIYGGLDEEKILKISKHAVKIEVVSDSESSEHEDHDEESQKASARSEEEEDPHKNDDEEYWNKCVGDVRDQDVEDLAFDDLSPEEQEMLKANPLNIIMLEDRQDQPVRPRDEDILRHLGFSEEAIKEQLQENRKQDD